MIKKQFVILGIAIILAVLFATATVWFEQKQTSPVPSLVPPSEGDHGTTFVLNTTFPKVSDSYLAYKTVTTTVTKEYAKDIGSKLGLTGNAELYMNDKIRLVDDTGGPRKQVTVYGDSGAIHYYKEYPASVESQPILPSEDDAKRIASDYLLSRDLFPEDAEFKNVGVSQTYAIGRAGSDEPIVSYNVTLAVRFSRSFKGIPVYGHDELAVIIGNNSEVLELVKNWRDVEPYKNVTIKTPEQAYEDLIAGKSVQPPLETMLDQATINEISIGYWMEPRINKQEFVLPVYAFTGTAIDSEGREEPFRDFVSAVRSEGLESLGVVY